MTYYVGLDVVLRSLTLCVVDTKGDVAFETALPCEIEDVTHCLHSFGEPIEKIGFEAGTMS